MTPPITEMSVNTSLRDHTELAAFVHAHNLTGPLEIALKLIEVSFGPVEQVEISMMGDPESGEEWVEIAFPVTGSIRSVRMAYDRYLDSLIAVAKPEVLGKIRIYFFFK